MIRNAGTWQVALRDGVASAEPVSDWLASRPGTRLATIRQGRGYAVLSGTTFEIVAATGESCGTFSLPPAAVAQGDTRTPARLDVGQDGTLIELSGMTLAGNTFGLHCAFRWWGGLLR